ncbi:glycoside hydrolase family 17 protein [Hebeloma cylindrosporum]|uniref:glucan endo-1,3-beta-D-glucosidase n=1 Tax=Hebeloma cylindrosporum TaxID=76867 RepID=A0A0C3BTD3_HEBCY|nr:glycoside hydrolase family 17 protein [Hebeloma cylindrosporum h7]
MEDLHTPTAQNPFSGGTPLGSRTALAGGAAAAGLGAGAAAGSYAGSEPKLGAYAPGSAWMEPHRAKSNRRKWVIMGIAVAVAGIIIIAVTVGVVVSNNSKKNAKNLSSSGASSNSTVKQTDPNDPSKFTKDSNLHQAFYGIAYTPVGSQLPDCGNSLAAVIQDVQIMSQLTTRIRLYGADCNQSALVLEAVKQTKVNMTVYLGNYPIATDNGTAYERQRDLIKVAIQTYGTDHIGGVTVGNEFMLNYVNANGVTDPNSAVANQGAQILIGDIQDTRSMLSGLGVSLPVGNSDAGSYFNNEVLAAVDYGMANVHPWFANVTADASASWTADFFSQQDVALADSLSNKPKMYIAETGWPTKSSDAGNANNGASTASIANLQIFLDTFICQANNNGTGYFFFEFADEDWKDKQFGGVEGWWGLFNQDRTLKSGITVPNCQSP